MPEVEQPEDHLLRQPQMSVLQTTADRVRGRSERASEFVGKSTITRMRRPRKMSKCSKPPGKPGPRTVKIQRANAKIQKSSECTQVRVYPALDRPYGVYEIRQPAEHLGVEQVALGDFQVDDVGHRRDRAAATAACGHNAEELVAGYVSAVLDGERLEPWQEPLSQSVWPGGEHVENARPDDAL